MTELNHTTGTDPDGGDAQVTLAGASGGRRPAAAGNDPSRDPAVGALLGRLGDLPDLPVARHGEVYAAPAR